MAPPIQFGLGLSLARAGGAALDADAAAYIAAVETAGATVSGGQKSAINTFVKTGKSDGWYSSLKRLYLPIWASAAPNAIDMIALGSGTFNGTVTHSAGYIQSDGTTGYFDTVTPWQSLITLDSATIGTLNYTTNPTANLSSIGIGPTIGTSIAAGTENSSQIARAAWAGAPATLPANSTFFTSGIQLASRFGGVTRMTRRSSSGIVEATNSGTTTGIVPDGSNFIMARNSAGSPVQITTAQIGAGFISAGMGSTDLAGYSLNLKTLWETCTGLTLP
jgi:hypothetical protein